MRGRLEHLAIIPDDNAKNLRYTHRMTNPRPTAAYWYFTTRLQMADGGTLLA
ncbi:MAG: hypothetical protein JWR75_1289 [Devosia sp.]|nr:hypothetical protein [Devosia sp.]